MKRTNPVALAARTLTRVLGGLPIQEALDRYRQLDVFPEISFLCFRSLRNYYSLRERLSELLHQEPEQLDVEVWCLLLLGACQLQWSSREPSISVSRTVSATRSVGKGSASSLVNAVLRNYEPATPTHSREAEWEVPEWMIDELSRAYPELWQDVLEASLTRAPLALRVNRLRTSLDTYSEALLSEGLTHSFDSTRTVIFLDDRMPMRSLPGYHEGMVSVQDSASQQAVPLLELCPFHRVLDACASPGQKSRQMLEQHPGVQLKCIDISPRNQSWSESDAERLGLDMNIEQADATTLDWWDGKAFDCILIDAPCSGTGTMRRHPDLKVTLSPDHIDITHELQCRLVDNLWQTLAVDGILLYCTCSVLPAENDQVVAHFLNSHPDAETRSVPLSDGLRTTHGHQLLPTVGGGDGFYFSLLQKSSNSS